MAIKAGGDLNAMAGQIIEWEKAMDDRDALRLEVAQLSEALEFERGMQCDDEHMEVLRSQREELREERDALKAEVARLRVENNKLRDAMGNNDVAWYFVADALRAKLAKLRAFCTCDGDDLEHKCDSQQEWDGYSAARADALAILDDEDSDHVK